MYFGKIWRFAGGLENSGRQRILSTLLILLANLSQLPADEFLLAQATGNRKQETASKTAGPAGYFPPPESKGGWRSLLPENGPPGTKQKQTIRERCGMDWDALRGVWDFTRQAGGNSGLLVIRYGYVVGEWYRGCDRSTSWNLYSSSKSYTSTAYGILLGDAKAGRLPEDRQLDLETKVFTKELLPEAMPLSDPRKAGITLRHLLTMRAGFAEKSPPATAPLEWAFGKTAGSPMARLVVEPGSKFLYSNGGAAHLVVLFHRLAGRDLFPFLKQRVFDPIGIQTVRWETIGGKGHLGPYSTGYSGLITTPREHARFCYLALHRGNWSGYQLVPREYFDFAWQGTSTDPQYGAMWWIDRLPNLVAWTRGARKNNGYVVPDHDLIFVRVGDATAEHFPPDFEQKLAEKVIATIVK